jgi:uncharacterized membrane protein
MLDILLIILVIVEIIFVIYISIDMIKSTKRTKELDKKIKESFDLQIEYTKEQMKALEKEIKNIEKLGVEE